MNIWKGLSGNTYFFKNQIKYFVIWSQWCPPNMTIFIFSNAAYATISIEVTDDVINSGKTDIDILCNVNGTSLKSIESIQLKKSNSNIVSITQFGLYWQDENLRTRTKVNATIENVNLSYLHWKTFARHVERRDEATYLCLLLAIKEDFSIILQKSDQISINITGTVTF